mmetsp:Transcript_17151/g.41129  ORF Transcript_17151/g.41129 Transcript_17151/m.41129 type:complete len:84 (+) Transcript_17151:42-293(+)
MQMIEGIMGWLFLGAKMPCLASKHRHDGMVQYEAGIKKSWETIHVAQFPTTPNESSSSDPNIESLSSSSLSTSCWESSESDCV